MTGTIVKALSGFYYVDVGAERELVTCRGRGKLRHQKIKPLVGDHVDITVSADGTGMVDEVLPRTNQFQRPMVANMEQLVILASEAIPVTDPFLIDRMISLAEYKGCEPIICFNKWDLEPADQLVELYRSAGFQTLWENPVCSMPCVPSSTWRWGRSVKNWGEAVIPPAMWSCSG